MTNQDIIRHLAAELKRITKGHPCHRCFGSYRDAGAIEALLIVEGVIPPQGKLEYRTGGKKYFPLIGDFRWTESYPSLMLRKAEEYLKTLPE